jgi:flagellar hook-associated protein 3 FlgL
MRLSTNTIFEQSVAQLQQQQTSIFKLQEQIASGRRILTPGDDPIAAAQAAKIDTTLARNTQFGTNRLAANSSLQRGELAVRSVGNLLQDVREVALQAGNAALSNSDRAALATEIRSQLGELFTLANARDENGDYIFAGNQSNQPPFVKTNAGAQYVGDQGQRVLQVADKRQVQVNVAGWEMLDRVNTGNGVFAVTAQGANTGAGIASSGSVTNPSALTGHNYRVTFTQSGGSTTYDVVDLTAGTTLSTGNTYASGQAITFDGLQFEVQGAPATGDAFDVQPSSKRSLFATLADLANLLETPVSVAADRARLQNGLNQLVPQLDHAQSKTFGALAQVGANLQEVERLQALGEELDVQYKQNLSELQDIDYAKAITDLTRQQSQLEAAQKSFVKISSLSIFEYI